VIYFDFLCIIFVTDKYRIRYNYTHYFYTVQPVRFQSCYHFVQNLYI